MNTMDYGETIMVTAEELHQLLTTNQVWIERRHWVHPDVFDAIQDAGVTVHAQPFADAYLLKAETAWRLMHHGYALGAYNLDECSKESYAHPAVKAEIDVLIRLDEEAPRTMAALSLIADAEFELLMAQHRIGHMGEEEV
jgi:hypothetical protein